MEEVFANTVLRFEDGAPPVDLRGALDAAARAEFARAGLTGPFAILSAHPRLGRGADPLLSQRLTHRLRAVIAAFGAAPVPLVAGSPGGEHVEPSLAAALERADALAIARLFDQDAAFWFDGESMWIDWTDGRASTALPLRAAPGEFRVRALHVESDRSGAHPRGG